MCSCALCNSSDETDLDLLRDCHITKQVWEHLTQWDCSNRFARRDFLSWIKENIDPGNQYYPNNWHITFGITIWRIWNHRNQLVFNGTVFDHQAILKQLQYYLAYLECGQFPHLQSRYTQALIGWEFPQSGWVKLNVDGSRYQQSTMAGCGGVLRDCCGCWRGGFSRNLGSCSVLMSELWAILSGLQMAWDRGLRKIKLESDSRVVVSPIRDNSHQSHLYGVMLENIHVILRRDWVVHINHVYREANLVADWLANLSHSLPRGLHIFSTPPAGALPILWQDISGVSFSRRIVI